MRSNPNMNDSVAAVRELRSSLGDTLQAFATRLGLSISAIANYERGREPTGKALYSLERLARAHGRYDLASVFAKALAVEMDWANEPAETVWAGLVRELVRNKQSCPGWPGLAQALVSELESLISKAKAGMLVQGPFTDHESNVANLESWLVDARFALAGSWEKVTAELIDQWLKENPGRTPEEAKPAILQQHPELYPRLLLERANSTRGSQYEARTTTSAKRGRATKRKK